MEGNFHGVLACSGNAARFAAAKGVNEPYPKHLEFIGGKTLLQRTFESMVRYIPVSGITVTLNPQLQELYLPQLQVLQDTYPSIEVSYTATPLQDRREIRQHLNTGFERDIQGLRGQKIEIGNQIVAMGFGDTLIEGAGTEEIKAAINDCLPSLVEGSNLVFYQQSGFFSGRKLYQLSILDYFATSDTSRRIFAREVTEYGVHAYNINTPEELFKARRELESHFSNPCES